MRMTLFVSLYLVCNHSDMRPLAAAAWIIIVWAGITSRAFTQDTSVVIKGRLTTRNGDAISGCNATIKGTTTTVVTGTCGEFEIQVADIDKGVVVFSCLAFRTWEVKLKKFNAGRETIISLADWRRFDDGTCKQSFRKSRRITIR